MADSYFFTCVHTMRGLAYLVKQKTGMIPKITRAVAGEGFVDVSALTEQTEILEPVGELEIGPAQLADRRSVRLPLRMTSENLDETALIRQIGVFAEDEDGEFLDTILQYDLPQALPSTEANRGAVAIMEFEIVLTFENGEIAVIPASPGWFLSRDDLDMHSADPLAHEGKFQRLDSELGRQREDFTASQGMQDARIKLLEDTLITDIQENKKIIVFSGITEIKLDRGVWNKPYARIEC